MLAPDVLPPPARPTGRSAEHAAWAAAVPSRRARLAPLVLAAMASQALLVVLSPTAVAIARDLHAPVAAVVQARTVTAGMAIAASLAIAPRMHGLGVRRLLRLGAALGLASCAAVAAAPSLLLLLLAHVLAGAGLACLVSAAFGGVAAFSGERRAWAIGHVAGANAVAWILVNPLAGALTGLAGWRAAQAAPAVLSLAALVAACAATPAPLGGLRLRTLLAGSSARRWLVAEVMAYAAWTGLLTFIGALLVDRLHVREAVAGWLLAGGAACYLVGATHSGAVTRQRSQRRLVAGCAVLMAALLLVQFGLARSVPVAFAVFCLIAVPAGVRTAASSDLGLAQLPAHPGAMMAARTAATQLGYLLGATVGGLLLAGAGYAALGLVLSAGMAVSASLVLRVDDPAA